MIVGLVFQHECNQIYGVGPERAGANAVIRIKASRVEGGCGTGAGPPAPGLAAIHGQHDDIGFFEICH
jgi:hypothetical protein